MKWKCTAKHCPDKTGSLEAVCKTCPTYTERDIECPMTHCEAFPSECHKDSIFCKRCSNYDNCY